MSDDPNSSRLRSLLLAEIICNHEDEEQRKVIEEYTERIDLSNRHNLMISPVAWERTEEIGVDRKLVFAHPDILQAHPKTSLYYRGISLLSRKRVADAACAVTEWEKGNGDVRITREQAERVAQLYNSIISSIIEGDPNWTLEDGHRNILATMGITLDGMFRNKIGAMAEALVKNRIVKWLKDHNLILESVPSKSEYLLPTDVLMRYGAEPDIEFIREGKQLVTIEIKGGTDPAGALERLGAMSKSFAETPPGCVNFLVAGVVTEAMKLRIEDMGVIKVYELSSIAEEGEGWDDFCSEIFHYTLRLAYPLSRSTSNKPQ